jgi:hypothetical protein
MQVAGDYFETACTRTDLRSDVSELINILMGHLYVIYEPA